MTLARITDGMLVISDREDSMRCSFSLDDAGHESLKKFIAERDIEDMLYSSSIDFPEENGAPDMDVRAWIEKVFPPPPIAFPVDIIQKIIDKLEAGEVDDVISRLKKVIEP